MEHVKCKYHRWNPFITTTRFNIYVVIDNQEFPSGFGNSCKRTLRCDWCVSLSDSHLLFVWGQLWCQFAPRVPSVLHRHLVLQTHNHLHNHRPKAEETSERWLICRRSMKQSMMTGWHGQDCIRRKTFRRFVQLADNCNSTLTIHQLE